VTATWSKADEVGFVVASGEKRKRTIAPSSKNQEEETLCEG
jgi:hypothetical protein